MWNNYINYRVTSNLPEDVLQTAGLLCELCFLRDVSFTFSSSCFSSDNINYLISDVYRDWVLCHIVCYMYIGNFHNSYCKLMLHLVCEIRNINNNSYSYMFCKQSVTPLPYRHGYNEWVETLLDMWMTNLIKSSLQIAQLHLKHY